MKPSSDRTGGRRSVKRIVAVVAALLIAVIGGLTLFYVLTHQAAPGVGVDLPEGVEQDLLPLNPYSRPGTPLNEIRGVVIHYVGNPGTSARANRNYFANLALTHQTYASSHFVVGLAGEVLQCIPLSEIAYCSNDRNRDTIAIEVCHPGADGQFTPETYASVVRLTAWLCGQFHLTADDVIRHYDVTGKLCPLYYVEHPEAWEQFRQDVTRAMAAPEAGF